MKQKEPTYKAEEKIPNCLIRVFDWKVIQKSEKEEFKHLLH